MEKTIFQGIFIIAIVLLFLSWLVNKLRKAFCQKQGFTRPNGVYKPADYSEGEKEWLCRMQEEHDVKAASFAERILKPREEAKRLKKEKDFLKFLGPTFTGQGSMLGDGSPASDLYDDDGIRLAVGREAAQRRNIPDLINQAALARAMTASATAARPRQKQTIQLPPEPDINEEGVISVMLRTPTGTVCCRRFYNTDTIQCLLSYITSQGFNERRFAVSTSFPRMILNNPQACFSDYSFGSRVALNIEERE